MKHIKIEAEYYLNRKARRETDQNFQGKDTETKKIPSVSLCGDPGGFIVQFLFVRFVAQRTTHAIDPQ